MKNEEIIEYIQNDIDLNEKIVTTVDSTGTRTKKQDAKTRARKANQTSSLSKAERKSRS